MNDGEFLLLADADVIIHFFRGNQLKLLPKILPYKLCLLDAVVQELERLGIYSIVQEEIGEECHLLNIDEMENEEIYFEFVGKMNF
jgi:hypothetical protein